jgi:hypothetical protein
LRNITIASALCLMQLCATACKETPTSEAAADEDAVQVSIPSAAMTYATPQDYQCVAGRYLTPGFSSTKSHFTVNVEWRAYVTEAFPDHEAHRSRCFAASPQAAALNLRSRVGYTQFDWAD